VHYGGHLGAVLDRDNTASDVWADTAYHSAANLALLDRPGRTLQFQRKKPREAGQCRPRQCHPRPGALVRRTCSTLRNVGWAS
jgi:hypothetical protein